jgi:hypothetical protein
MNPTPRVLIPIPSLDATEVPARWPGHAHLLAQTLAKRVLALVGCASAHRSSTETNMVR